MMRVALVGLIRSRRHLALAPGIAPRPTIVTRRTSCAGACHLKSVLPCNGGRSAPATPAGTGDLEDPKSVFDKLETEKRALKLALKLMGATKSSEKTAIY